MHPAETESERLARRLAHQGQRTPPHIVSAINLIADYCATHGYPCVVISDSGGAAFRATNIYDDLAAAQRVALQASPLASKDNEV